MKSVLVDQRFDLGQLGDLVNQRSRVITGQGLTAATAIRGPTIGDRATPSPPGPSGAVPCDVPVAHPVSDRRVGWEACV